MSTTLAKDLVLKNASFFERYVSCLELENNTEFVHKKTNDLVTNQFYDLFEQRTFMHVTKLI